MKGSKKTTTRTKKSTKGKTAQQKKFSAAAKEASCRVRQNPQLSFQKEMAKILG